ncbi:MAG: peptidase E [Actinomycetota bacterium]|nr:peptidase E [Actinomycetota bacterium]
MPAVKPTILATSGGFRAGSRSRLAFGPLVRQAIELSGVTGRAPRLIHLGTANGDQRWFNAELDEAARAAGVDLAHLNLFPMPSVDSPEDLLLGADVVWVGGGSVANLLALWRVHGIDGFLRQAWEAGVVLAGASAGSICWHQGGTTDSFGPELRAVTNGLAFLPYGNGVHYDSEVARRPLVHKLVGDRVLPRTYCTDDGVGLLYRGQQFAGAFAETAGKGAYVVELDTTGKVGEERIEPEPLS